MDLTSPKIIKELLAKYETRPSKGLGQNFLIDKNILKKIIETAEIKNDEIILEVGPGLGVLTQELIYVAGEVIAIEKDETMIKILSETVKDFSDKNGPSSSQKKVKIINDDILKSEINKYIYSNYKVVANIPYYLTSPLIRKFLELENQPEAIILMIQKEVAQRICAKPPEMSILSVAVQFYADATITSFVSKNCFWPSPKIDSAIIKIIPHKKYNVSPELFFNIVKAGFLHPRKQLVNNLATLKNINGVKLTKEQIINWLLKNNLKFNQRPETLTVSDWVNLTKSFNL